MIVLDASLAVKLIITETDSAEARRWFAAGDEPIVAPDLIAIEVAQAIVRRVNAQETATIAGQNALRAWRATLDSGAIGLMRSSPETIETAAMIAMQIGHPLKDCLYLELAIDLGCDLATCDATFRTRALRYYPGIRLLADYHPENDRS